MDKIKATDCEIGKWYHDETWGRVLSCGVGSRDSIPAFATMYNGQVMLRFFGREVSPLHDCTGWDWQPEPKYRAFKDHAEFAPHRDRWITRAVKDGCFIATVYTDSGIYVGNQFTSYAELLEFTFADTNEPCGVKL